MESLPQDNSTPDEWYSKRKKHWEKKEATMKSVLGGWEETHLPDIKCSNELLAGLIYSKQLKSGKALDCGAGIGRVTEYVLLNHFEMIDLMEQDEKFVNKSKEILKDNPKIRNITCSPLQTFDFNNEKYDLMWIQWCLENIEDQDLNKFMDKCREHLNDDGVIIVKENYFSQLNEKEIENKKEFEYSEEDLSKQRRDSFYINLFFKHKFKIIKHFVNPNWPSSIMPLIVYVLIKEKNGNNNL